MIYQGDDLASAIRRAAQAMRDRHRLNPPGSPWAVPAPYWYVEVPWHLVDRYGGWDEFTTAFDTWLERSDTTTMGIAGFVARRFWKVSEGGLWNGVGTRRHTVPQLFHLVPWQSS